jgi:SAM-dependent methyltransferase
MKYDVMGDREVLMRLYRKYADCFNASETVLDIGCGSGVFLELLREKGVKGVGVEINDEYAAQCEAKKLDVKRQDALVFLRDYPNSFNGIMAAHLIEHFNGVTALQLISLARDALKTGGLLILITPNTKDLGVITENFWLDITHQRPYPLKLLRKMLSDAGFSEVRSGEDADTIPRLKMSLKSVVRKLRFGEFINRGDIFIIGRKNR